MGAGDKKLITGEEHPEAQQAPDDVATLYSWANLQGAKYRDFSASRREARMQARQRIAEQSAPPPHTESGPAAVIAEHLAWAELSAQPLAEPSHAANSSQGAPRVDPIAPPVAKPPVASSPVAAREAEVVAAPTHEAPILDDAPLIYETPAPREATPRQDYPSVAPAQAAGAEQLYEVPDRAASRWFALKGIFDQAARNVDRQVARSKDLQVPALAVFSLAGGVGKSSLIATLGRTLASRGERVLLVDATAYGMLPFYFGARDLRPGVVRTFSGDAADVPVQVLSLDVLSSDALNPDPASVAAASQVSEGKEQDLLTSVILRESRNVDRLLIDLGTASASLTREVLRLAPTILVPVVPDMSSVVSLQAVDAFFRTHVDGEGRVVEPFYILNRFDVSIPLHRDVREVLREQLGDRLLPFILRRSPTVNEALAEGMTVVDYAPKSPVTEDYASLSNWIRGLSAPASRGFRGVRWSER